MDIWWVNDFKGGHLNMFIMRTAQLHKQGLCIMGDLWSPKLKLSAIKKKLKVIMGWKGHDKIIWERIIYSL
jgi:hypothetical protein